MPTPRITPFKITNDSPESLKALREALGLSQEEAALLIKNASQTTVGRWEARSTEHTSDVPPYATRLLQLALAVCEMEAKRLRRPVREVAQAYFAPALLELAANRSRRKSPEEKSS